MEHFERPFDKMRHRKVTNSVVLTEPDDDAG